MKPWLRQPSPPVADIAYISTIPLVGMMIAFNASSSFDWDEDIVSYCWDFGDSNVTSTVDPVIFHSYALLDTFNVTLTVLDSKGLNSSCFQMIAVMMPTFITISTNSSSTVVGCKVDVTGTLHDIHGNGLENETVVLHYNFRGISTWTPITSDTTNDLGYYHAVWIPPATGYFTVEAKWNGNATHLGTSNTTTLSSLIYNSQYVFSVESNSMIQELVFNTTSWQLSFTATGPNGTEGYARITVAKSLIENVTNAKVYLDCNPLEYSIASTDESWLLTFSYKHSTHYVVVDLTPEYPTLDTTPPTISILSPENKTYTASDVLLTFTVSESTSWIGYSLDTQGNVSIAGNRTLSDLSDGLHNLIVYANDTAENTGASEIVYFTIEIQQSEPFPTWVVGAAVATIAIATAAIAVFWRRRKQPATKG